MDICHIGLRYRCSRAYKSGKRRQLELAQCWKGYISSCGFSLGCSASCGSSEFGELSVTLFVVVNEMRHTSAVLNFRVPFCNSVFVSSTGVVCLRDVVLSVGRFLSKF